MLAAPPGLDEDDAQGIPSAGSALHHAGGCRPCAWFWKDVGCQNGATCSYCHLCNEGALKAKKKNKLTMKRLGLATLKTGADVGLVAVGERSPATQAKFALSLASLI